MDVGQLWDTFQGHRHHAMWLFNGDGLNLGEGKKEGCKKDGDGVGGLHCGKRERERARDLLERVNAQYKQNEKKTDSLGLGADAGRASGDLFTPGWRTRSKETPYRP